MLVKVVQRLNPKMEAARTAGRPEEIEKVEAEFATGVVRCIQEAQTQFPEVEVGLLDLGLAQKDVRRE